ncbi:MAG: hypothetical protein WBL84_25775 [Xanthobacteraceae bacterium]|jgi:hypothetical protein
MTLEVPPQYQKNRGGRPPGPRPIADRVVRLQMAAAAARLYPKVLAFWEEVLEGTATCEQDGKKFLKYTTEDRLEATRMIMAYGFGKPVQPLTGAYQEQRHQILHVRWLPPDPNDHSKLIEPEPD